MLTVSEQTVSGIVAGLTRTGRPVIITLEDGSEVTAKIVEDYDSSLENDGDWYGKLCSVNHGDPRPEGFDGNAEKLTARNCQVWWQPPTDVVRGSESFKSLRERVAGYFLEHWSYIGVVVTRVEPCPTDPRYTRKAHASLWGIESDANAAYLSEVVADLLAQVTA